LKRLSKLHNTPFRDLKKWFLVYLKEADKLNKSEKFIVEENLPDFSDDENEARVEASVIFTPE